MSSCCLPASDGIKTDVKEPDCCAAPNGAQKQQSTVIIRHCPVCAHKGKGVDTQTVKAMLDISLHAIRPSGYGFCQTENCPVVYFSLDGEQTLAEIDLRVQVHQKHPEDDDVSVCYCFRHTPGSIRVEWVETGQSTAVETVTKGTQTGQCACEIRNPQGSCCLGNVRATVKRVMFELEPCMVDI